MTTTAPRSRCTTNLTASPPPPLVAALAAARRGWPVFPLYPNSTHPALHGRRNCPRTGVCATGHQGWEQRATTDVDELARWWRVVPYNIGIACGPARLVVIDLDSARSQKPPREWAKLGVRHGRDVLRILAQRAGQPDPDDTYTVTTPGKHLQDCGGEHRYFHAPDGIELRNSASRLGWHVDIRAAGGFVTAAGSQRIIAGTPRLYRVLRDTAVQPLPQWLVTALTPPPAPQRGPTRLHLGTNRVNAYVQAALNGETHTVAAATVGTRATTLFASAASLGELVGAGLLEESTVHDALLDAAPIRDGADQFTLTEAEGHITNGLAYGRRNPRQIDGLTD